MWKFPAGVFTGLVVAAVVVAVLNIAPPLPTTNMGIPHIQDGFYTVYSSRNMFDTQTGEPIYWLVAGRGHVDQLITGNPATAYIEPDEVRIFRIARANFRNASEVTAESRSFRIMVANGNAILLQ